MAWSAKVFVKVAAPILVSPAFTRLFFATFLGILSPRYKDMWGFPAELAPDAGSKSDQTRAHHSVRVSWLLGELATNLQLSPRGVDYAIAWGLLHDISTWPLSHTGEAAFGSSTNTSGRSLRTMMICGADQLSNEFSLYPALRESGLDHGTLLALFDKNATGLDEELGILHQVVHSALTPDSIEGMHRSGEVYNVRLPHPHFIVQAFERDLVSGVRVKQQFSEQAFRFWRGKSKIYSKFINSWKTIEFESMWSRAIREAFFNVSLNDSLRLSETEIIRRVVDASRFRASEIQRYKEPLSYALADGYERKRSFEDPVPVSALSKVFVKKHKNQETSRERFVNVIYGPEMP